MENILELQRAAGNRAVGALLGGIPSSPTSGLFVQRAEQEPIEYDDDRARPAIKKRLAGGKYDYSNICFAYVSGDEGIEFHGHSMMLETADGHAERVAIKKLCSESEIITNIRTERDGEKIGKLLKDKKISLNYIYVDFQPCEKCNEWLQGVEKGFGEEILVYFQLYYRERSKGERDKEYKKWQAKLLKNKKDLLLVPGGDQSHAPSAAFPGLGGVSSTTTTTTTTSSSGSGQSSGSRGFRSPRTTPAAAVGLPPQSTPPQQPTVPPGLSLPSGGASSTTTTSSSGSGQSSGSRGFRPPRTIATTTPSAPAAAVGLPPQIPQPTGSVEEPDAETSTPTPKRRRIGPYPIL